MDFDDNLQDSELDELQQLAAQFMDDANEPASASRERQKVYSDDFDILPTTGDGEL